MKLAKALNDKQMDVRIVDRLLAEGKISKSDLDNYLQNLPDEEGNFESVSNQAAETTTTEQ